MTTTITLLGSFEVDRDGVAVPASAWGRRHAAALVKLLALAPHRRLHREQVIDALWPDQTLDAATPRLHKAAHFARRALGEGRTVVVEGESLVLLPDDDVTVDAVVFEALALDALRDGDPGALAAALERCGGDLLPADPYEEWLEARRTRCAQLRADLLRRLGRWEELVALDPTDEAAHVALVRALADRGDVHGALRQYERLERALGHELGTTPGPEAQRLRDEVLTRSLTPPGPLTNGSASGVRRAAEVARIDGVLADAAEGRGRTVFLTGPPGVGKSELLATIRRRAEAQGWRVGEGVAALVEGEWAYAPVLEALADLCRRQPTLLDGLDDAYRDELDRALVGGELGWSGEGGHQRLFVAAAELLRLASADRGLVLLIDDVHEADDATTRLLHYLARCALNERAVLVVAHRDVPAGSALGSARASLLSRGVGVAVELDPLDDDAAAALVGELRPELDEGSVQRIVEVAGGIPFTLAELAVRDARVTGLDRDDVDRLLLAGLDPVTRDLLQRAALLGVAFDTDEFVAVSGLPDDEAFEHLDRALAGRAIEHTGSRYRFRHTLVREALLADIAPHRRQRIHREAAERLERLGAPPSRVGHHLHAAGDEVAAAPHLLRAAEREAAVGAYRDALELVELAQPHIEGELLARALALRADLLFALGDPTAPGAYRRALQHADDASARLLRARLARAVTAAGDIDSARAALDGLELDGGPADPDILLGQAMLAVLTGDDDAAWALAEEARSRVFGGDRSWQVVDLVALQGLLAHLRGEWFDRIRVELQRTRDDPELALAIFDGYLCPAEFLLYGPTPYDEVIRLAASLRDTANRAGALRAVAFAAALSGEASLLAGDLDAARAELHEAAALHRDIGAPAGEAHCLQRLAEVELASGDPDAANALLQRALPLARWSMVSLHLLQRIYGTMIQAAPDEESALAVVHRAEATLGTEDLCRFCNVMLAVPATVASARGGDLARAERYLAEAEESASLWDGTAWAAALLEARAHVAEAEGDHSGADRLLADAARRFDDAGHPLDAARCRTTRVG